MDRASPRSGPARSITLAATAAVVALVMAACVPAGDLGPLGSRPAPTGPPEREMVFPVGREVSFSDTFGAPRGGGTRTHEGQDLMAPKGTPLVATADGEVSWMRWDNVGNGGNILVLTDNDGWEYWYIHINNDTPGTDDGVNTYDEAFADGIKRGQRVKAGEVIAWVGDSGNAEHTGSHLHFEMHDPTGAVVNGFNSLAHASMYVRGGTEHAADAAFGFVDSVSRSGADSVDIVGWGIDMHSDDPIEVSVYVDGNPVATNDADMARPDVAASNPGRAEEHGFSFSGLPIAAAAEVCVVLHSIDGGGNVRLPCVAAPA